MFSEIIGFLTAVVLLVVPGLLLSKAWFRGTSFTRFEKFVIGVFLGIALNPLLSAVENTFLGVKFNFFLILFNSLLLSAAALVSLYLQKAKFGFSGDVVLFGGLIPVATIKSFDVNDVVGFLKKNYVPIILLILMAGAFYPRVATSWKTDFFEFDPYFYAKISEQIVRSGEVAFHTDQVYNVVGDPLSGVYYRGIRPVTSYLTASLYSTYAFFTQPTYNKDTLILANGFYPPFIAALMVFFVYLFFKTEYSDLIGLIAAGFAAFTPQLITKFAAGVFELQSWGIFLVIALLAIVHLAFKQKSYRLGLLAALLVALNVLSSSNYVWGLMILASFLGLKAFIDYYTTGVERKDVHIALLLAGTALASDFVYMFYQKLSLSVFASSIAIGVSLLVAAVVPYALFYFMQKMKVDRKFVLVGVVALVVLFVLFTPIGSKLLSYPSALTGFAVTGSPLSKTIQEEGASSIELFQSSYGVLNPPFLMLVTTLVLSATAFFALWNKDKLNLGLLFMSVVLVLTLLNGQLDAVLKAVAPAGVPLLDFFINNDVFLFMGISFLATILILFYSEEKRYILLLGVLMVFPVAFIGLSKLKFIMHLAAGLTIAVGFLLGELFAMLSTVNNRLKILGDSTMNTYVLGLIVLIGFVGVLGQLNTVQQSMTELSYGQIPPDWTQAMSWVRQNTPLDARFISWWDYGHWITFLGERKSVLDPGNLHPGFNQETAHAFVEGPSSDLVQVMKRHGAQYVILDADLIPKWGALVFLSGSCDSQIAPNCPPEKQIVDWEKGPGQSAYEAQHYFETLQQAGNCPSQLSPVSLPLYKSSFGAYYCVTNSDLLLVNNNGVAKSIPLKPIILGDNVSKENAYVIGYGQNTFLNVNPYLGNLEGKVLDAPFTRLFFFESLPGFSLAYKSPNGMVKIFKLEQ